MRAILPSLSRAVRLLRRPFQAARTRKMAPRRRIALETLEPRMALDAATTALLSASDMQPTEPQVDLALTLTKPDGSPLTTLSPGDEFILHVTGKDLTADPHGVYAAYLDVTWDSALATTTGPIRYNNTFPNGKSGKLTTPGLLDEAGAFSGGADLGSDAHELFSVPMRALTRGDLFFSSDPADVLPDHETLLLGYTETGQNKVPPPSAILYGSASIHIGGLGAFADHFGVAQHSGPTPLDVLANDAIDPPTGGTLTITGVTPGNHGGTITISQNGAQLIYTPAQDFVGDEQFQYTIADGHGGTASALVTVRVETSGNHPPIAVDDTAQVFVNTDNVIPVLANDSTAPDTGETLTIIAVTTPSNGGTVSISGGNIIYRPRDSFALADTFTYTINDGRGGTATATVNVIVIPPSASDPHVEFISYLTRPDGSPPADLQVGQEFVLHVLARDASSVPRGVFAAYLDVAWDAAKAVVAGPIQYGSNYPNGKSGDASSPGRIDEVGAFSGSTSELGDSYYEVFSVLLRATGAGNLEFTLDPADQVPIHDVLVYGFNDPVPPSAIRFSPAMVHIGAGAAHNDIITVPDNTADAPLDVLANDSPNLNPGDELTIVSVTAPSAGGTVEIAPDFRHLIFRAAPGFGGALSFNYTVSNSAGQLATALVTLNVLSTAAPTPGVRLDGGILEITGAPSRDNLSVNIGRHSVQVRGTIGAARVNRSFSAAAVQQIVATLGDGNDALAIRSSSRIPVRVDAGAGNDTVTASAGSAILLGGDGNDTLRGGSLRDLLIGGHGRDRLFGSGPGDLLIGGTTAFDQNPTALLAIKSEWNSQQQKASRAANLTSGSGQFVQSYGIALKANETVFDDGDVDSIFGTGSLDWLVDPPPTNKSFLPLSSRRR
jgi:Bacterial Ig domain/RTX calcium-binding nonapeptide repeat (4 copies)